jgi:hypothetical protein
MIIAAAMLAVVVLAVVVLAVVVFSVPWWGSRIMELRPLLPAQAVFRWPAGRLCQDQE